MAKMLAWQKPWALCSCKKCSGRMNANRIARTRDKRAARREIAEQQP
jgi:hypothetical protein